MKVFVIAILINIVSVQVMADRDVSLLQISEGDWIFIPTTLDGSVESFVGFRIDSATGENITTVWFLRTTEETWDSWAWSEQDQGKAIACVKSFLALPDSTDNKWPVAMSTEAASSPKVLKKGVFESDPFESTIDGLADPKVLVTMLEDTGWAAAWLELWDYDCEDEVILDTWADVYEYEYSTNEHFKHLTNQALMQNDCLTTEIRDQIRCWVDQYWVMFDAGTPISFDGTGLGIHQDWHPFHEVALAYQVHFPEVQIVDALVNEEVWEALSSSEQQAFRDLSHSIAYTTFINEKKLHPDNNNPGRPPPPVVPSGDPNCDHSAFYHSLNQHLQNSPFTGTAVERCLNSAGQEGRWPFCLPKFDCDDYSDTIGACALKKLADEGYGVDGRNKGVWVKCPSLGGFGHAVFGLWYCGYWYIIDGSGSSRVIAIIPGTYEDDIPIDSTLICWLVWEYYGIPCDEDCYVKDLGEFDLHDRPLTEPHPWYTNPSEVARVVACLRTSGMNDTEIAEAFGCSIPAEILEQVLQWFDPLPDPPPPNPTGVIPAGTCSPCFPMVP